MASSTSISTKHTIWKCVTYIRISDCSIAAFNLHQLPRFQQNIFLRYYLRTRVCFHHLKTTSKLGFEREECSVPWKASPVNLIKGRQPPINAIMCLMGAKYIFNCPSCSLLHHSRAKPKEPSQTRVQHSWLMLQCSLFTAITEYKTKTSKTQGLEKKASVSPSLSSTTDLLLFAARKTSLILDRTVSSLRASRASGSLSLALSH